MNRDDRMRVDDGPRRGAVRRLIGTLAVALTLTFATAGTIGLLCNPAYAVQPDEVLADPELEARARALSAGLRCMVCQNQSIDDSDAELARDLRLLVRERLKAGDSDAEVRDYLVDRYGEFVLLNPRLSAHTLLLWFGAPAALLVGILAMLFAYRRRKRSEAPGARPLDPAEEAELKRVMEQ